MIEGDQGGRPIPENPVQTHAQAEVQRKLGDRDSQARHKNAEAARVDHQWRGYHAQQHEVWQQHVGALAAERDAAHQRLAESQHRVAQLEQDRAQHESVEAQQGQHWRLVRKRHLSQQATQGLLSLVGGVLAAWLLTRGWA